MDFQAIARDVTALLAPVAPYAAKAGGKLAETLGEKVPDGIGRLWSAVVGKLKGRPTAEEALRDVVSRPADPDCWAAFRKELRKALEEDGSFVANITALLRAVQPTADRIANVGSGAVAPHGGVSAGEGGVAVGRDVQGDIHLDSKKGA